MGTAPAPATPSGSDIPHPERSQNPKLLGSQDPRGCAGTPPHPLCPHPCPRLAGLGRRPPRRGDTRGVTQARACIPGAAGSCSRRSHPTSGLRTGTGRQAAARQDPASAPAPAARRPARPLASSRPGRGLAGRLPSTGRAEPPSPAHGGRGLGAVPKGSTPGCSSWGKGGRLAAGTHPTLVHSLGPRSRPRPGPRGPLPSIPDPFARAGSPPHPACRCGDTRQGQAGKAAGGGAGGRGSGSGSARVSRPPPPPSFDFWSPPCPSPSARSRAMVSITL